MGERQVIAAALTAVWLALSALLALEGAYYFWSVFASQRAPPAPAPVALPEAPHVVVQVPVKDEGDVVDHALRAIAALDWPRDRLEAQLIDDSDAAGWRANAARVDTLRRAGVRIAHLRGDPLEHKAGALRAGLAETSAQVVCILDADFAPPPSFLREAVPRLLADERIACVQARWSTRNARASWVAGPVALALDAHFLVEQRARAAQGALLSFIGTGAVWRRDAIERAGGWSGRTLAEDVDLGAIALAQGRRFVLLETPTIDQEVPASVGAFRTQQARWARGSMQCARLHAARIVRERSLPRGVRAETLFHLTHYAVHPLIFALFLLTFARPWMAPVGAPLAWSLLAVALVGGAAPFLATAARVRDPTRLRHLPLLTLLGLGISWSNTRAVAAGLFGARGQFTRTPKGATRGSSRPRVRWEELAWGVAGAVGAVALLAGGWWAPGIGAAIFAGGFLTVALAR